MKANNLIAIEGKSHLSKKAKNNLLENTVNITVEREKIIAPRYLTSKQKTEFLELANELIKLKTFTHLDCEILGQFIYNSQQAEKVCKELKKIKFTDENYEKLQKIYEKHFKIATTCGDKLGLNPMSRSKLVVQKSDKKKNKFEGFIK